MYEYQAKCMRVVDGDTVQLLVDCGLDVARHLERARLEGINAPELGTPQGAAAFSALRHRIEGKTVLVRTIKLRSSDRERTEKWGRYLVQISLEGEDINAWLVAEGHAERYDAHAAPAAAAA